MIIRADMDALALWGGQPHRLLFFAYGFVLQFAPWLVDDDDDLDLAMECFIRRAILHAPPVVPQLRFDITSFSPASARLLFRFEPQNILRLADFLLGRAPLKTSQRDRYRPAEGLCILLRVLASPCRLVDLVAEFGRQFGSISRILSDVAYCVAQQAKRFLSGIDVSSVRQNAEDWTNAVENVTGVETGLWGFLDGKFFFTGAPVQSGVAFYTYKKRYALKFQVLMSADGLAHSVSGPYLGTWHDWRVCLDSGILPALARIAQWGAQANPNDQLTLSVGADSAYSPRAGLMTLKKQLQLDHDPSLVGLNDALQAARTEIEHFFALVTNTWPTLRCQDKMRLLQRSVPSLVWIGVFLTNCCTCANGGNQISDRFNATVPVLPAYLQECTNRALRMNL